MTDDAESSLKLVCDRTAIDENWRYLDGLSGNAACGAAVKANAYGLGVENVVPILHAAGCRDFYVATWAEAADIAEIVQGSSVTVLNGVQEADMPYARRSSARPMLNSADQIARWRTTDQPCDVMINTGMNRLGVDIEDIARIDWSGLKIETLASHLASADEDVTQNREQLQAFRSILDRIPHKRSSLANSAGIALGREYAFDLTRPGLALYGGIPRNELVAGIRSVGSIEAQILQRRMVRAGDPIGYNAKFTAPADMPIAIISIGYADGYLRGFSNNGTFHSDGKALPVIGRVSMDLVILDMTQAPDMREGDWVSLPLDLPELSRVSGLSQYEVLTSLGNRFDRIWTS